MKTAISIPDRLYKQAEKVAKQRQLSRSELYARALQWYLSRIDREEITRQANAYADQVDTSLPADLRAQSRRILKAVEW
ncbi:MAG TPA: hypothetical protein PLD59_13575 [Tepidisphaeraceae bacterium]|nr:hypothetical protein [Tepidisphaeraceae bacterium]